LGEILAFITFAMKVVAPVQSGDAKTSHCTASMAIDGYRKTPVRQHLHPVSDRDWCKVRPPAYPGFHGFLTFGSANSNTKTAMNATLPINTDLLADRCTASRRSDVAASEKLDYVV